MVDEWLTHMEEYIGQTTYEYDDYVFEVNQFLQDGYYQSLQSRLSLDAAQARIGSPFFFHHLLLDQFLSFMQRIFILSRHCIMVSVK